MMKVSVKVISRTKGVGPVYNRGTTTYTQTTTAVKTGKTGKTRAKKFAAQLNLIGAIGMAERKMDRYPAPVKHLTRLAGTAAAAMLGILIAFLTFVRLLNNPLRPLISILKDMAEALPLPEGEPSS